MNISISLSIEEATNLAKELNIDTLEFLKIFSKASNKEYMVADTNVISDYSLEAIQEWFEKISWRTFYFSHLILIYSEVLGQQDEYGNYLDAKQLALLGVSERSAASRVGGSRRVCKTINISDILYIKTKNKGKRKLFYVDNSASEDILEITKEFNEEYAEELHKLRVDYPDKKNVYLIS